MTEVRPTPSGRDTLAVAGCFALATLLLHMLTNGAYGYFRDELLFLAAAEHLDWGYVDHAPLVAVYAWLARVLFDGSLQGLRFFSAFASAGTVMVTGLLAREFGARRYGVGLACMGIMIAPVNLVLGTLFSMNPFEPLFWSGSAYVLALAIRRDNPKLLLWLGVLMGLGLENKHSIVFFGCAMVAGLLLTPQRRLLVNRWMWIAGAIAIAIFLPNIIWQIQHNWATLEDLQNVKRTHKNVELGPLAFTVQQISTMLPLNVLIWGAGLWFLLFRRETKLYRALGWTFLIAFGIMMALKGKDYYLAPAYPIVFAAGGLAWEHILKRTWMRVAFPLPILAMAVLVAPMVLPILPPERLLAYQAKLGIRTERSERSHTGPLQQHFGDQFGWEEMVATVARVYYSLPPAERAKAAIYAGNYGEAGAIDFFGPRYGLPKSICAHQTYFFWGPRQYTGEVMILLQSGRKGAEKRFASVEDSAKVGNPWSMGEEHYTILIGRGLKYPLTQVWPKLKHWN